jgi:hypothetical protein
MVRMIGPGEFSNPETIFPGMLEAWNNLFLQERIKFVEKQIKKNLITDIGGVTEANKAATSKQIINSPGPDDTIEKSHITAQDIAKAVYVVYFDVASREVLFTQRKVSNATGFGFRNYWFRVIKDAEGTLSKYR